MTKISVIIPIYNVEKYIQECIESVINQTLNDIEIILVDDESPDSCPRICDEYAQKDSRIKVIHQKNKGLGGARNTGLDIATGDYILFVDSDDWIKTSACRVLYDKAIETNADIVLSGNVLYFENTKEYEIWQNFENYNDCENINDEIFLNTFTPAWGRLYKKEFIKNNHLRFIEKCYYEDNSWGCLIAILAKKTAFVGNMFYYRQRDNAITAVKDEKVFDWVRDFIYCYDFALHYNLDKSRLYLISYWYLYNFYHYFLQLSNKNKKIFLLKIKKILPLLNLTYDKISKTKVFYDKPKKQKILKFFKFLQLPYFIACIKIDSNILQRIFSIKNSFDKRHKVITICCMKIKIKRKRGKYNAQ